MLTLITFNYGDNNMSYHKKDLKTKILDKTYELVNQKGYQKVSVRMIARELSVSSTAIYRHYESYSDLMNYVIEKGDHVFSDYLLRNYNEKLSLFKQLHIMAENYITFALDYPFLYDLMFISEYTPITSEADMICDLETQGMSQLISIVDKIIKEKKLNTDLKTLLTHLWAYIQGYSYLIRFHHFEIDHKLLEEAIKGILGGSK
jgi:AcrR family transcriptional regulator